MTLSNRTLQLCLRLVQEQCQSAKAAMEYHAQTEQREERQKAYERCKQALAELREALGME